MIAEPRPIAVGPSGAGVDPLDFGRPSKRRNPAIDRLRVIADRVAIACGEHDEELIERSELPQVRPERRDRASLMRQEVDDIRVQLQARQSDPAHGDEQQ